MMKSRIAGLIAIGLLAAPMAARAGVIYQFEATGFSTGQTFVYEAADFITSNTHVPAASLLSCTTGDPSKACLWVDFFPDSGSRWDGIGVTFPGLSTGFWFDVGAFGAFGTYATDPAVKTSAILTVIDSDPAPTPAVPEPASVPLLAFSLAAAGLSMRRKQRRQPDRRDQRRASTTA